MGTASIQSVWLGPQPLATIHFPFNFRLFVHLRLHHPTELKTIAVSDLNKIKWAKMFARCCELGVLTPSIDPTVGPTSHALYAGEYHILICLPSVLGIHLV